MSASIPAFDAATPAEIVAEFAVMQSDPLVLVELLREQLPAYCGRSASQVSQLRGYVLAQFARTGLPDAALPYVLEELESSREACTVAAAARAIRGATSTRVELVDALLHAAEQMKTIDDAVSLDEFAPTWPIANPTTALTEIRGALAHVRACDAPVHACCASRISHTTPSTTGFLDVPGTILEHVFEDQARRRIRFGDFFIGQPSIVTFFYTRCPNPEKCSATITRLAALQRALQDQRLPIRTAAITYDPEFDLPQRLYAYGANRGMTLDDGHRMLRSVDPFDTLRRHFDLGVNFTGTTVNRHRIELFVFDANARTAATCARLQWAIPAVLELARAQLSPH